MNAFIRLAGIGMMAAAFLSASTVLAQDRSKKEGAPEDKKTAPADDKQVYRNVAAEKIEAILKSMKIDYKKVKGKADGIWFYDFERNDYKIRLHNYQGNDLWIDAHFNDKLPLEEINKWNARAKFSRAVQLMSAKQSVSLESQIDCVGGVSDGIIRQFIQRFDGELMQFSKFLSK